MAERKTHAEIGGINFVLKGIAKSNREDFDMSYGSPTSYWKLKPTQLTRVWDSLQVVLIKEGYKSKPEKKKKSKE